MTNVVQDFDIVPAVDDHLDSFYTPEWETYLGYYLVIPELQAVIDKKAIWTVGKGFDTDSSTLKILSRIKGCGKDTIDSIFLNMVKSYSICGDSFAEIIKNSRGELRNLKPLSPGSIRIYFNKFGIITKYSQKDMNGQDHFFNPDEIFHLSFNRISDQCHGVGSVEKLKQTILMRNEALEDMKIVFHRYVKPLWIFSVDTDDTTAIDAFKAKVDKTVANAENLVVPKDTVSSIERVSIPRYSSLDPLPWIELLEQQFILCEGVPAVILGSGKDTTEATSKILYLAFQQMVEWNQRFLEENVRLQLGYDIKFKFPASIIPQLQSEAGKERSMGNMETKIKADYGGQNGQNQNK